MSPDGGYHAVDQPPLGSGGYNLPKNLSLTEQPTKGAGTLRRAVRSQAFDRILGGRHMECAYYFDTPTHA